jgi:hypothetical protein
MKVYAQHGALAGQKINEALQRELIDGVIFSPRDISHANLRAHLADIAENYPAADRLFDPQYYTCLTSGADQTRLGYLPEDYSDYFVSRRRIDFARQAQVEQDIRRVLNFQRELPLTYIIAPNILISRSFDSRETSIAIDFITAADGCYAEQEDPRPLLLTLAISRDALIDRTALTEFVTEITGLSTNAAGYYLLIATNTTEARSEIFHGDVIAAWMFLNYALHLNGFNVINGYSDLITPFLCAADAEAGATGWWSNLRTFSLNRFSQSQGGGRLPIQRYLSIALLNRITFSELDILRRFIPSIMNNLVSDNFYPREGGSEPERNAEVLQSWDSLHKLNEIIGTGNINEKLEHCLELVIQAEGTYHDARQYVQFDQKSNDEHLAALKEGVISFKQLAELARPAE